MIFLVFVLELLNTQIIGFFFTRTGKTFAFIRQTSPPRSFLYSNRLLADSRLSRAIYNSLCSRTYTAAAAADVTRARHFTFMMMRSNSTPAAVAHSRKLSQHARIHTYTTPVPHIVLFHRTSIDTQGTMCTLTRSLSVSFDTIAYARTYLEEEDEECRTHTQRSCTRNTQRSTEKWRVP